MRTDAKKRNLPLKLLAAGLAVVLLALALSCLPPVREWLMVGTWQSDGSFSITGMNTPLNGAESLTLRRDGTGSVKTADGDVVTFEWSLTRRAMTLTTLNAGYGVYYQYAGPILRFRDDGGMVAFSRT